MPVQLPKALLSSAEYLELNVTQARNFAGRLNYVSEIVDDLGEWIECKNGGERLEEFLDHLEVDVAVNQNAVSDDEHVSNYVIHNTWGDRFREVALRSLLSPDLNNRLNAPIPRVGADESEAIIWLESVRSSLGLALSEFAAAPDFAHVLSTLLAVDVLLSCLLTGIYKLRFR